MARVTPTTLVSFGDRPMQFSTPEGLAVRVLGPAWKVRGQRSNPVHPGLVRAVIRAEVIHCHQPHTLAAELAALAARATRRRVFASDLGGGGWGFSSRVNTDRWFHGHLHISNYSRQVAGHDGKPWSHVILGGVDTERFSPEPSAPRSGRVLFVGRLLAHKGVDDLIRAVPADLPVELIGRPYDLEYLNELHRLAEGKQVIFRHDCEDHELIAAYRAALCVVLPSVYRDMYGHETRVPELLGQTLLEGMACGIPAVCTDVASMPEVMEDGETGFVVPPHNPDAMRKKLMWLRDHPTEAAAMGKAARKRVLERFTWPAVVRRCLSIYADQCAS
jgi:glycosyltransferase involved in cell wall biosynthesis